MYLRARYYNPRTGRFTQEDPTGAGLNWYTYCANNPLFYIDPWGLKEVAARAYAESYGATVTWTGNGTSFDGYTYANAVVTYNGVSLNISGFLKNGNLMTDDSILNNKFGWGDNDTSKIVQDIYMRVGATSDQTERDRLIGIANAAIDMENAGTPYIYVHDKVMNTLHANAEIGTAKVEHEFLWYNYILILTASLYFSNVSNSRGSPAEKPQK